MNLRIYYEARPPPSILLEFFIIIIYLSSTISNYMYVMHIELNGCLAFASLTVSFACLEKQGGSFTSRTARTISRVVRTTSYVHWLFVCVLINAISYNLEQL